MERGSFESVGSGSGSSWGELGSAPSSSRPPTATAVLSFEPSEPQKLSEPSSVEAASVVSFGKELILIRTKYRATRTYQLEYLGIYLYRLRNVVKVTT